MNGKKLFILFLIVFLGFNLGLKQTWAQKETGLSLRDEFKEAKLIEPGEHKGGPIKEGETEYYKIEILPGYQMQVLYKSASSEFDDAFLEFTLYNEEEEILSTAREQITKDVKMGVFNLPGTSQDSLSHDTQLRFLEIKASQKDIDSYTFEFKKVDKTDAGSDTDAGDDFDVAQEIKSGDYPENFLAKNECGEKYCSTDEKDMFKVAIEKGEKLTVKITPNPYLQPKIVFYNELKEKQKEEVTAAGKGIVVEAFYISDGDQNVYFSISDASLKDHFGSYAMDLSVKEATAEELEEAGIVKEEVIEEEIPLFPEVTVPEEAPLVVPGEEIPEAVAEIPEAETFVSRIKGVLIWLVIGVIVFIGIIVAIVILILKARKKPPRPPVASPKTPTSPKVPPTGEAPPIPPEAPRPPTKIPKPSAEPLGPEEGKPGMILPPKELRGK